MKIRMMSGGSKDEVLSPHFETTPYWWRAAAPQDTSSQPLPEIAEVVIVGSGYTGLCCALELADAGVRPLVLEAGPLGAGASTRSGAMVTGGQKFVVSGAIRRFDAKRQARILEDAGESLQLVGERVDRYALDADYRRYGRVILADVPRHMTRLARWAELLHRHAGSTVSLMNRAELSNEVGGRRYHGGLLIEDYGGLHPAKYHRALADAARARGAILASHTTVADITREAVGFRVRTSRGEIAAREVVIGTNGYSGSAVPYLRKRVVPIAAYVAATEALPLGMAEEMIPHHRMLSDTQRSLYWMRLSPDGTRLIFGARPSIFDKDARTAGRLLHRMMCGVWPHLAKVRVEHCWNGFVAMTADHIPHMGRHDGIHYAVGCNGSGVAMMSYLGYQTARKLLGNQNRPCAFDSDSFPAPPFYDGWPWFIPLVSGWYHFRDGFDRAIASL
ncbi:MAG: FAD-binding oxidoreductase [Acidobacteriaceae bacterium]|nr:FAD-binding oxidoreductase [Acidobacteriaceae bacterium]